MAAAKKKREDYDITGPDTVHRFGAENFKVHIMCDYEELFDSMAFLAKRSRYKTNKQTFGPFKVTVTYIPPQKEP